MKQPVIIIGSGRSGTNALRDALCSLDDFHTWPCDEINYIWRSGNRDFPTDELPTGHATARVKGFIRHAFEKQAAKRRQAVLVEKTCANSLRVGFVNEVIPEARFVHIVRDGRDVTSSAMLRWKASLDLPYVLRKARFVPVQDVPYYAVAYLRAHWSRFRSDEARLTSWGPRFAGLEDLVASGAPLDEICARQWAACVSRSIDQLRPIDPARVHHVLYEDLIARPAEVFELVVRFCGSTSSCRSIEQAASRFHGDSAGAWRDRLTHDEQIRVTPIVDWIQSQLAEIR